MTVKDVIKIRMIKKKVVPAQLAREHGLSRWAFYRVISGKGASSRVREILAKALGTTPERLWGKPMKRKRRIA